MIKEKGFSLTEVMLAGALLAGLGVAFMKMMSNQNKSLKTVEADAEIMTTVTQVQKILQSKNGCEATFANRFFRVVPKDTVEEDGVSLPSIRLRDDSDYLSIGQRVSRDLTVSGIVVKLVQSSFDPSSGYGSGVVELSFAKDGVLGGKGITKSLDFYARFTALRYYTVMTENLTTAQSQIAAQCRTDLSTTNVNVRIIKTGKSFTIGECLPTKPVELYIDECV